MLYIKKMCIRDRTKAFNIAGLQTAAVMIPNKQIRHKVNRGLNTDEVAEPNAFAIEATIAAFTKGEPWLSLIHIYFFYIWFYNEYKFCIYDEQPYFICYINCFYTIRCSG